MKEIFCEFDTFSEKKLVINERETAVSHYFWLRFSESPFLEAVSVVLLRWRPQRLLL